MLGLAARAALVFGLLALTLWGVRRTAAGRGAARSDAPVRLVGTTRLAKWASLALVRIGGTTYALGVTEHAVSLLTETDLADPATTAAEPHPLEAEAHDEAPLPRPGFAAALQAQTALLLRRTGPSGPAARTTAPAGTTIDLTAAPLMRSTAPDGPGSGTPTASAVEPRTDAPDEPALEPACPPTRTRRRTPAAPAGRAGR